MKKATFLSAALIFLFSIGPSKTIFAQQNGEPGADLRFAGIMRHHPLFRLDLNNSEFDQFNIVIKDESNEVLYRESVKGRYITRKYELNIEESELNASYFGLRVEISSMKTNRTETYKVSTDKQAASQIVIAKL